MNLANLLTILAAIAASAITVWATLRADRTARDRDREQQLEQVKGLLQTMVVDRIEVAFGEIAKLDKRQNSTEKAYSELRGFLRGKGCIVPDFCPDDLREAKP
jgi:ADP-ribosylglycohydrolase